MASAERNMDSRAAEMEMIIFRSVFLISPSKGGQEAREFRFFFTLSMGAPVSAALLNSIIQLTIFFLFSSFLIYTLNVWIIFLSPASFYALEFLGAEKNKKNKPH